MREAITTVFPASARKIRSKTTAFPASAITTEKLRYNHGKPNGENPTGKTTRPTVYKYRCSLGRVVVGLLSCVGRWIGESREMSSLSG